ncbi:hypothetical protein HYZ78_00935 [Candidatus Microgenomates bacterium]|nr:hypothetical protein [Candidatus Microgenomates bacterium]
MSSILRVVLVAFSLFVGFLQPTGASAQADCVTATITQRSPEPQTMWTINAGTWRTLGFWTNQPESKQTERKLILAPDQYIEVLGGGTLASWPAHCQRQAVDSYNRNPLPAVDTDQLGRVEWLCCDSGVLAQWETYLGTPTEAAQETQEGCPPAQHKTAFLPTDVEIAGGPALVHPWWNNGKPPWGQTQTKTMMRPENRTVFVQMMGEYWLYENTDACNSRLESELANAPGRPTKSFDEYRSAGLIR